MKIKRSFKNQKTTKSDWIILFNILTLIMIMQGIMFLFINSIVEKI
jgi:hypothetical protein